MSTSVRFPASNSRNTVGADPGRISLHVFLRNTLASHHLATSYLRQLPAISTINVRERVRASMFLLLRPLQKILNKTLGAETGKAHLARPLAPITIQRRQKQKAARGLCTPQSLSLSLQERSRLSGQPDPALNTPLPRGLLPLRSAGCTGDWGLEEIRPRRSWRGRMGGPAPDRHTSPFLEALGCTSPGSGV